MEQKDKLEKDVKDHCLLKGHFLINDWRTGRGFHSRECILVRELYLFKDRWAQEVADLIFRVSTSGIVGFYSPEGISWMEPISEELLMRGAEMNFTEVYPNGELKWGDNFEKYLPGSPVTIFTEVNTLGGTLRDIKDIVEKHDLVVAHMVAAIHRHPDQSNAIDGVKFSSAVHIPLSLYPLESRNPIDICAGCRTLRPGLSVTSIWS